MNPDSAIAFQLMAVLEDYAAAVERMVAEPDASGRDLAVRKHIDAMRSLALALPAVSVPWVEVLIRHFELAHAVWRLQAGRDASGDLEQFHDKHRQAVEALRNKCLRLCRIH